MAADAADTWRNCFRQWPADVPRRGVLVTSFNEQILFDNFATSDDMLLIERATPDTVGARMLLLSYQTILALKIVDVVKAKAFQPLGFDVPPPRK
jgi:hypothetical protein